MGDQQALVGNYSGTVSQTTLYSFKAGAIMGEDSGKTNMVYRFIGLDRLPYLFVRDHSFF